MKLFKVKSIENYSGVSIQQIHNQVKVLRKGYYHVLDIPVGGDAPKDFICVYKYGEGKKKKIARWPKYIAKVGHKWYPIESVTEYLLNQIGEVLGLRMAKSELRVADEQLRFLSKYFLKKDQILVHGAQIFSGYLEENNDDFVTEIETTGLTRELLTFQVTKRAIELLFPNQSENIVQDFVKMLCFDAITGNNDRHFYNWGVITDVHGKIQPHFSPIYDTARGLFWNFNEEKIDRMYTKGMEVDNIQIKKYIDNSLPKTGWEGIKKLNHFDLIIKIVTIYPILADACIALLDDRNLHNILNLLDIDFKHLFSEKRYSLIEKCLKERFRLLKNICNCN